MKKYLCSFINLKYENTVRRIENQVKKIDFFDDLFLWNETNLSNSFTQRFNSILKSNIRGYGYWVWKPQMIKELLCKINDGDILIYMDAGCHIRAKGKFKLIKYIELLQKSDKDIIAFQKPYKDINRDGKVIKNYFSEKNWTKEDSLSFFGVRNNNKILNTPQIVSGVLLIQKSKESVEIINQWADIMHNNFSLVDDSDSKLNNCKDFIENRHDQSILSLICKINQIPLLSTNEIEGVDAIVSVNPIIALRDICVKKGVHLNKSRMKYKSFFLLRLSVILKNPILFVKSFIFRKLVTHQYYE